MPTPRQRSRSLRKVFKKAPGGRLKIHYLRRKPKKARCAGCETQLAGVPRERPVGMRKLAKTQRRPERMYGGVLCGACVKRKLIIKIRSKKNA